MNCKLFIQKDSKFKKKQESQLSFQKKNVIKELDDNKKFAERAPDVIKGCC